MELKEVLQKKYNFYSQTDTEVIVHLIEQYLDKSLEEAVEKAVEFLKGSYAIAVIAETDPDKIVICRRGSPLVVGLGKNENHISSDINAVLPHTKDIIYVEDNEIGVVTKNSVVIREIGGGVVQKEIHHIQWDVISQEKSGYPHFMLKEIFEQPTIIRNIISKMVSPDNTIELKHIKISNLDLDSVNRFIIQACGTSWHAGLIGKYLMENYARILTEVDISSEFRYRQMLSHGNDIVLAISQSGETADTLACLREAKSKYFKVLSIVNVKGSSIDRESNGVLYSHAGPEIGVASTKNFVAQLVVLYLFTLYMGKIKKTLTQDEIVQKIHELKLIPDYLDAILNQIDTIKAIAQKYAHSQQFLFIGRGVNYPSALEGALKLKEISYIHATGYPAGELKHGPIALIDSNLPVVCIAPKTGTYEKMISNIQEVRSRKGKTIVIATQGDTHIQQYADDIIYIPEVDEDLSPILVAVPLQLLAYHIATALGCDVDQPRNLAKSVTVE